MKKKHTERPGLSNETQLLIKKSYATILRNAFKNDPLRRDVEPLIKFLDTCGFYKARCHSHHRYTCGAAQHQLEVLMLAIDGKKPNDMAGWAISCLLHDLCDVYGYWGHGSNGPKSVYMIEQCAKFPLTDDERLAIYYHMKCTQNTLGRFERFMLLNTNPYLHRLKAGDCKGTGRNKRGELTEQQFCDWLLAFIAHQGWVLE